MRDSRDIIGVGSAVMDLNVMRVPAVCLAVLTACGEAADAPAAPAPSPSPTTFTANAVFSLYEQTINGEHFGLKVTGKSCEGGEQFEEIDELAQMTIEDETGKTLGVQQLGTGFVYTDEPQRRCVWPLRFEGLPLGARFLKVDVARRGLVTYTVKEAREDGIQYQVGLDEDATK